MILQLKTGLTFIVDGNVFDAATTKGEQKTNPV